MIKANRIIMGLAVSTALLLGGCVNELANVPTPEGEQTQQPTDAPCSVQIDGVTTVIPAGEVLRLKPGQSISFEPYMYHEFWSEGGHSMIGEVSTVNDDENDNRFLQSPGRYPSIEEDEPAEYLLCNEYCK